MTDMADPRLSRFRGNRDAPPEVLFEVVRPYVVGDDWDRPHRFLVICWDGTRCWVEQESLAMVHRPEKMKLVINRRAYEAFDRHRNAMLAGKPPTLYAVALVMEGHGVRGREPGASQWERARLRRDREQRRFREREDAVELRAAWIADIDGRQHHAGVRSDRPDGSMVCFTIDRDGENDVGVEGVGGLVASALWAAATANAHLLYGEPVPASATTPGTGDVVEFRPSPSGRSG
jgi:hypothetical protein